jgi:type II secretory pathway component PulC
VAMQTIPGNPDSKALSPGDAFSRIRRAVGGGFLSGRFSMVVLAAISVVLSSIIYAELDVDFTVTSPEAPSASPTNAAVTMSRAEDTPYGMPSSDHYRTIIERPLFSPTRRAPPPSAARAASEASAFLLRGVIVSNSERFALLQRQGTPPKLFHVGVGQEVEGWTVESIDLDRILIRTGTTEQELKLYTDKNDRRTTR